LDPEAIGIGTWSEIGRMLTNLWFVVLFVVFFAANLLVAHNVVPSFVASGHIPVSVKKAGVAFYVLAIISLGLALFFLARVVGYANGTLRLFWDNFWI
jgi:hypothetical protein